MAVRDNCKVRLGKLPRATSEQVVYDICIQAGRVRELRLHEPPSGSFKTAFCEYHSQASADYAVNLLKDMVKLHGQSIIVEHADH